MSKAIDAARRAANRATVVRKTATVGLEVRAAKDNGDIPVSGHAALFNTLSQPLYDFWEGRFVEQIAPGAFSKTLQECDCRFLINHDPNLVLARYRGGQDAGTLALEEDGRGLAIAADMAPTSYAQDLALSMKRGDVTQMSFAMQVMKDDWDETDEGTPLRTVQEVKLYDVSAVTYPAYEQTEIGLRSREARALLHSLGLLDIPDEQRAALWRALTTDDTPTDALLPALRAAHTALAALVARAEPAASHSEGYALDLLTRRHALKARQLKLGAA